MAKDHPNPLAVLRNAFVALQVSHPDMVAKLSAAMESTGGLDAQVATTEAAFRDAARALLPTDRDAAETLFALAELLAQTALTGDNHSCRPTTNKTAG